MNTAAYRSFLLGTRSKVRPSELSEVHVQGNSQLGVKRQPEGSRGTYQSVDLITRDSKYLCYRKYNKSNQRDSSPEESRGQHVE